MGDLLDAARCADGVSRRAGDAAAGVGAAGAPGRGRGRPAISRAAGAPMPRRSPSHTRLYPGAVEAVEAVARAAGFATAICTNKPEGAGRRPDAPPGRARICSARWSGPIRCRCASPIPRPCTRRWRGSAARWRGRCWWAIPMTDRQTGPRGGRAGRAGDLRAGGSRRRAAGARGAARPFRRPARHWRARMLA